MAHQTTTPPAQRIAVLAAVLVLHLLLLLAVLATRSAPTPPPVKAGTLSVISIPAEQPAATPPPPPTLPSEIAETNRPLTEFVAADQYDPNAIAAPAGGCATVELVTKALLADPVAVNAVIHAPPETRSIADAIVLWNAGWSEAARSIDAPLGAVRAAAELSLRSVGDGCLDAPIAGPRLIPIPAGERTMFVVFGSGNWSWRELIVDADGLPLRASSDPGRSR